MLSSGLPAVLSEQDMYASVQAGCKCHLFDWKGKPGSPGSPDVKIRYIGILCRNGKVIQWKTSIPIRKSNPSSAAVQKSLLSKIQKLNNTGVPIIRKFSSWFHRSVAHLQVFSSVLWSSGLQESPQKWRKGRFRSVWVFFSFFITIRNDLHAVGYSKGWAKSYSNSWAAVSVLSPFLFF